MRKILCRALLCLCLVLALGPVHTAFAQDLDRIESYDVDVTPNTEDGSLRIQVTLEWTVLAEGPVSWVKIGVPNGSIRQEQALTDYPTLMRPLLLRNSRYNQHATTGSLLVEVGTAGNAPEEAELAARLFAGEMVTVLNERSK